MGYDCEQAWVKVWRVVAPKLPTRGLERLRAALAEDDPRLLQGATTQPPPLMCVQDWQCEGGCLISYPFAFEDGEVVLKNGSAVSTKTVGEVEEQFARVCYEVGQELGEPAGVRFLTNWWDETDRATAFQELLREVDNELARRSPVKSDPAVSGHDGPGQS